MSVQGEPQSLSARQASPHEVAGIGIALSLAGLYFMLGSGGALPMPDADGPAGAERGWLNMASANVAASTLPPEQSPLDTSEEVSESLWISPRVALDRCHAGDPRSPRSHGRAL